MNTTFLPTLLFLLLIFPWVITQDADLSLHIPSLNLKPDDVLGFNFQVEGQDFVTFTVKLQTGCYLSKNFHYSQPTQQPIRLVHHLTIALLDSECPLDFTDDEFTNVVGITTKHTHFVHFSPFENRDLYYEIFYGIVDYKNKYSSSFAVVSVHYVPQNSQIVKDGGFGTNFIRLLSIINQ
jgi:hypothetical protein